MKLELTTTLCLLVLKVNATIYLKFFINGSTIIAKGYIPKGDAFVTAISDDCMVMMTDERDYRAFGFTELLQHIQDYSTAICASSDERCVSYLVFEANIDKDLDLASHASELDPLWTVPNTQCHLVLRDNTLHVVPTIAVVDCRLSKFEGKNEGRSEKEIFSSGISLLKQSDFHLNQFYDMSSKLKTDGILIVSRSNVTGEGNYERIKKYLLSSESSNKLDITLDSDLPDNDLRWRRMKYIYTVHTNKDFTVIAFRIAKILRVKMMFRWDKSEGYVIGTTFRDIARRQICILSTDKFAWEKNGKVVQVNPSDFKKGMKLKLGFFDVKQNVKIPDWTSHKIQKTSPGITWPLVIEY